MVGVSFTADKFGYYQVGDRSTYSKYEAIELAKKSNTKTEWNFNRSVFDALDWTNEPETDLWTLYKLRAQQIRDSYDYVVLWYSGGSDSHNILHAWLDAGLKIDEIATTWNHVVTGNKQNHYNAEITNVVLPHIKQLQDAGHEFKFRLVDICSLMIDLFDTWGNDFEYHVNFHLSPNNPAKHLMRDKIQDYKDLIAAGKKVCFLWGKEKPIIKFDEEAYKYYFLFCDNIDNCVGPYVQRNYHKGWYDELFYWTPDFPLIPVKQAQVVKNFLHTVHKKSLYEPRKDDFFEPNGVNKKLRMYLSDSTIKSILYPKWNNGIFCNGKTASYTYSIRDEWFFRSNLQYKEKFINITNDLFKVVDEENVQKRRNIVPHYSPKYWLE
jgi:hypothetical protein